MPHDPFEDARRDMEQARREFEEGLRLLRVELESAVDRVRIRMAEERERFEARVQDARSRLGAARRNPPRGRARRPSGPTDKGPGPLPVPVRPNSPSHLTGGAEAPLDP